MPPPCSPPPPLAASVGTGPGAEWTSMDKCGPWVGLPDEGPFEPQNGLSPFLSDQRICLYVRPY